MKEVESNIKTALQCHAEIGANTIDVKATEGIVTRAGTVDLFAEKDRVERAAWSAPGPLRVVNKPQVA